MVCWHRSFLPPFFLSPATGANLGSAKLNSVARDGRDNNNSDVRRRYRHVCFIAARDSVANALCAYQNARCV
jgi:hypothetical protein